MRKTGKRRTRILFFVSILALLLFSNFLICQPVNNLEKYSYVIKTYPENGEGGIGTGFFLKIDSKYYLLTALHVLTSIDPVSKQYQKGIIDYPRKIAVGQKFCTNKILGSMFSLFSDKEKKFKIIKYNSSDTFDITFMEVDLPEIPCSNYLKSSDLLLTDEISVGDSVSCYGFPNIETKPTPLRGKILYFNKSFPYLFGTDMKLVGGVSGAPIFIKNKSGHKVIGIASVGIFDRNMNSKGGICVATLNLLDWVLNTSIK